MPNTNRRKIVLLTLLIPIPWVLAICANLGAMLADVILANQVSVWHFPDWIWLASGLWTVALVLAWTAGTIYRGWLRFSGSSGAH